MEIKDYTNAQEAVRDYGGKAGKKISIYDEGHIWMLKFPQNVKNIERINVSYTNSPVSEYIGSHIYETLGLPVHETKLGIYNDKIVVLCKDFTVNPNRELKPIENILNIPLDKNLESFRSESKSSTDTHGEDLGELVSTFKYNTKISPEFEKRFWEMFVVDAVIGNNDRHNRNWGYFIENNERILAPVYDNGNSFLGKKSDEEIKELSPDKYNSILSSGNTPFIYKDKKVDAFRVIKNQYLGDERKPIPALQKAIITITERFQKNKNKIEDLIDSIPEQKNGIIIITPERKELYKNLIQDRYMKFLKPIYTKIKENSKSYSL